MKSYRWIGIGVIALVLLLGGAWFGYMGADLPNSWGMMGGPGMMWSTGMPLVGGLGMLLFWALMIAGIVWLVRIAASNRQQPADKGPASEMPLDVLKRRYASGEINKEQFEEMKRTLS